MKWTSKHEHSLSHILIGLKLKQRTKTNRCLQNNPASMHKTLCWSFSLAKNQNQNQNLIFKKKTKLLIAHSSQSLTAVIYSVYSASSGMPQAFRFVCIYMQMYFNSLSIPIGRRPLNIVVNGGKQKQHRHRYSALTYAAYPHPLWRLIHDIHHPLFSLSFQPILSWY